MRRVLTMLLVAVLLTALVLPALAGGPPSGRGPGSKGPKVKSKVSVEGTITALGASTFTMQIRTPGHQRQIGASTATFLVQSWTELKVTVKGSGNTFVRPASVGDLRMGDRAQVEALRLDDGRFLATRIHVKNRVIIGQPAQLPAGTLISGVVVAKGSNSLIVLAGDGSTRTVLATSTTAVRGQRNTFAEIQVTDSVAVQGTVAQDGTITATQIEVIGAGAQFTGVIAVKSTTPRFLLLTNGMAVSVADDTMIVSGGQRRSYADLAVGQSVTIAGTPITIGPVTIGVNARVISF